jgi:endogenous inhibitor of DNA gyrase (YacG/DUF329 family)
MPTAEPRCPICGARRDPSFRPFCSKKCADVDLLRWFNGDYSIETDDASSDDAEE